jgi:hypothetical protein
MSISNIIWGLLDSPAAPGPYRELHRFYKKQRMPHEASAIAHLIKVKFGENVDDTSSGGSGDSVRNPQAMP